MNKYSAKDNQLLMEAYSVQLLREQAPYMTLNDIQKRLSLMNESELIYINTVQERILNEFWGGLKNVLGTGKDAVQSGYNAAKGAVQSGVNAAKQVGSGIASAGSQVASNLSDIYQTGNAQIDAGSMLKKAKENADLLVKLLQDAVSKGILPEGMKDFRKMSLTQIINQLSMGSEMATNAAGAARNKGVFGGAGQAFKQGYGQQPQTSGATPPPLPQTA